MLSAALAQTIPGTEYCMIVGILLVCGSLMGCGACVVSLCVVRPRLILVMALLGTACEAGMLAMLPITGGSFGHLIQGRDAWELLIIGLPLLSSLVAILVVVLRRNRAAR
jgi:hypothetical protein